MKYTPKPWLFENGMLRFTQPGRLNDPDDARPELSIGRFSPEDYARARLEAKRAEAHSFSNDELETMFMTPFPSRRMDEKSFPGLWPATELRLRSEPIRTLDEFDRCVAENAVELSLRIADQQIGILSLTECTEETMWSYYASPDRTGALIGFDRMHPYFSTQLRPIEYSDSPIFISSNLGWVRIGGVKLSTEDILNGKLEFLPSDLFFRKKTGWQHEKEWRIIRSLSGAEPAGIDQFGFHIFLFEIPSEAVTFLVFDYRTPDADIDSIIKLISESEKWNHVNIKRRRRRQNGLIEIENIR